MEEKIREINIVVRDKDVKGDYTYLSCEHCYNETFRLTGCSGNTVVLECRHCGTSVRTTKEL
jgi:ribosomal protein S27E